MPVLHVTDSRGGSRAHRFSHRVLIGRDEGNDLRLVDPTVSGHHAVVLVLPDGSALLKDLRSANGTLVRGERIQSCRIEEGEHFFVGGCRIQFQAEPKHTAPDKALAWEHDENTDPPLTTGPLDLLASSTGRGIEALEGRSRDLLAMYALANAIHSCPDEGELFRAVGTLVRQCTGASQGAMVEQDPETGAMETRVAWPEDHDMSEGRPYSRTVVDRVVKDRQTILVPDVALAGSLRHAPSIVAGQVRTVLCAPLRSRSHTIGIIFAAHEDPSFHFQERHVQLLTAIGLEAGTALENKRLYHELEADFFGTIRVLSQALDTRDTYTGGHAHRVAEISVAIARCIPLDAEEVRAVRLGALLHDIGKIGVLDDCLKGEGALSDAQYAHVKEHTINGDRILAPLKKLQRIRPTVRHHHERWDGHGYPDALAGEQIPLAARIVAVADTLDAIASSRTYRAGQPVQHAVAEIERVAGTQLDPDLVPALKRARQLGFIRASLWKSKRESQGE